MKVTSVNKITGEVVFFEVKTNDDIVMAWQAAQQYEKVANELKDQLKAIINKREGIDSEVIGNFKFRINNIQRMNYDKAIMRNLLDEDTFDLLLKPDKPAIDRYLKENLEELGSASTELRRTMIAEGKPYQVIKLERIKSE